MSHRQRVTMALTAFLPTIAWTIFMLISPLMTRPLSALGCESGICKKNDCTEGSQYCLPDGSWDRCGSC